MTTEEKLEIWEDVLSQYLKYVESQKVNGFQAHYGLCYFFLQSAASSKVSIDIDFYPEPVLLDFFQKLGFIRSDAPTTLPEIEPYWWLPKDAESRILYLENKIEEFKKRIEDEQAAP